MALRLRKGIGPERLSLSAMCCGIAANSFSFPPRICRRRTFHDTEPAAKQFVKGATIANHVVH